MRGKHVYKIHSNKSQDRVVVAINATQPIPNRKSLGPKILLNYRDKTVLEHIVNLVQRTFEDPEIIIITGFSSKAIYINKPSGVKIVENQLFDSTREMENIRLVAQNTDIRNIIFMPDNMLISKEDLLRLSKYSQVVTSKDMLSEMVPVFENGLLYDFIYHKDKHDKYYGNMFSLSGRELDIAVNFSFKHMYDPYLDTEVLSEISKSGGIIKELNSESAEIII